MSTKILIYEDNTFLRNSLIDFLNGESEFMVAGAFENCDQVLDEVSKYLPDIVLMDIGMSGTNGLEGLKLIRSQYPKLPVMMLTVFEDNDHIVEAICKGASGYLLKNTAIEKIPEAIRDLLSGGAPMTPSIARKVIGLFQNSNRPSEDEFGLSARETEVLNLLTSGYSYKMIAAECHISLETVRSHIKKIYEKLQVHSATEAVSKILSRRS
jgi:DNA-binding NarL/FixJ family response regulator